MSSTNSSELLDNISLTLSWSLEFNWGHSSLSRSGRSCFWIYLFSFTSSWWRICHRTCNCFKGALFFLMPYYSHLAAPVLLQSEMPIHKWTRYMHLENSPIIRVQPTGLGSAIQSLGVKWVYCSTWFHNFPSCIELLMIILNLRFWKQRCLLSHDACKVIPWYRWY